MGRVLVLSLLCFVSLYSCHNLPREKRAFRDNICEPGMSLIFYRTTDMKHPCYVKCSKGHFRYCLPGELMFCEEGDIHCDCLEDPTKGCEPEYFLTLQDYSCYCPMSFNDAVDLKNTHNTHIRRRF